MKVKHFIDFYKSCNAKQLFKSREMHNVIVVLFFLFTCFLNIFRIDSAIFATLIGIVGILRLSIIHIHNMNVAFLDKHSKDENGNSIIIENISSYKRIAILNTLVFIETLLWLNRYYWLVLFVLLAILPTIYLLGKCADKLFTEHINDNVQPFKEVFNKFTDDVFVATSKAIDKAEELSKKASDEVKNVINNEKKASEDNLEKENDNGKD